LHSCSIDFASTAGDTPDWRKGAYLGHLLIVDFVGRNQKVRPGNVQAEGATYRCEGPAQHWHSKRLENLFRSTFNDSASQEVTMLSDGKFVFNGKNTPWVSVTHFR
jgi:hypothetical protein